MKLSERVPDVPRTATNVLVLQPSAPSNRAFKRLLAADTGDVHVAGVSFSRPPDEWVADWEDVVGRPPAEAAVVTGPESGGGATASGPSVYTVPTPGNLTGIGMKLSSCLTDWEEADADVAVVVESLTLLSQYAQLEALYRFLHVLTGRIEAVGARGQFFLDPTTQAEMALNTLKSLFDAVAERREDGEWDVATR